MCLICSCTHTITTKSCARVPQSSPRKPLLLTTKMWHAYRHIGIYVHMYVYIRIYAILITYTYVCTYCFLYFYKCDILVNINTRVAYFLLTLLLPFFLFLLSHDRYMYVCFHAYVNMCYWVIMCIGCCFMWRNWNITEVQTHVAESNMLQEYE